MTPEMEKKAKELAEWCFAQGIEKMCVGVGGEKLHVYAEHPASVEGGFIPTVWQGSPVEWHWNVGPARAFDTPRM